MTAFDAGLVVAFVALVGCLFVLAMVEASLLHVRRSAVAAEATDADPRSTRLLSLLDDLPEVMNTVLLAVLLVQVTSTAIAGVLAQRWVGGTGVTIATVAVTVVLFIYGEAIPKTIAIADPLRHARRFSRLVQLLVALLGPAVVVLVRIARWQYPQGATAESVSAVTESELLHLTGEAAAAGQIEASDAELIERSFTLGDRRVGEIVIPMDEVVSVAVSTPVASAVQTAIDEGHRRLIVHDCRPDRIIGFVRLRDLVDSLTGDDGALVGRQVRKALLVDRSRLVVDVLREMQRMKTHLSVVTGADGVPIGIVTVEDIVEELLGDIDEPDPGERPAEA